MSNISPFGGKNPPWARGVNNPSSGAIVGQANPLQPQLLAQSSLGTMAAAGMVQYQQSQQVFQTQMGMQQQNLSLGMSQLGNAVGAAVAGNLASQMSANQMFSQVNAVSYPTPRTLNPNSFQSATVTSVPSVQNQQANSTKQRVFTGTVTKVHDNFGFVDEDVFFQTSACVKGSNPVVGDRVLVEASFNANMPFKWNATRIQVLPMSGSTTSSRHSTSGNNAKGFNSSTNNAYNAVPPPSENSNSSYGSASRGNQRSKGLVGGRTRSREREREDDEIERKKRREERTREREEKDKKSPLPRRRSPKRRRAIIVPRYMVHIPKIALDLPEADVLEVRRRYTNLYVPSDFFNSQFRWVDAFPPNAPFSLNKPCSFHIMHKDVDPVGENPAVLEPSDADYLFSAKVMLMSMPTMQEVYQKCCSVAEERDHRDRDSEERDFVHPTRLVSFLVGLRGKNETMAVGGPWSPSLDGPDPDKNPSTLINTAVRTCRALTGIDLSTCTQWYRFVELYYRRGESTHKGKVIPARVETVVLFLPDVWSCVPTRLEWDSLQTSYRRQLERRLRPDDDDAGPAPADGARAATAAADAPDEKEEDVSADEKLQPTHYSELDPKTMSVGALRTELKARSLNSKGLKSQLVARLAKILKSEAEKTDEEAESVKECDVETIEVISNDEKQDSKEENEIKIDEKEKLLLEKRYALPDSQHIVVHPNKVAKSGKFDCCVMSLSLLLDYRPEDTKEHSFEVSLFAELFNEMLMRDFGFNIYKALGALPEKPKEEKDEKRKNKDEDRKKEDDKEKKKDRDDDKTKKDDRKDERENNKKDDALKRKRDDDAGDEENGDDDDDRKDRRSSEKDRDKKKKDRPKLVTKDPHLLLSFVYFDQTHCGYIFEKDIEDLLFTLGLSLSRAQVKKIVSKAITRDSLHYRKLTDRPKDEEAASHAPKTDGNDPDDLTLGNKKLLPVFSQNRDDFPAKRVRKGDVPQLTEEQIAEGFVMYEGGLLHVGKLMEKLKRVEKACSDTESRLVELKESVKKLQDKNTKASTTIKDLASEVKEYKEKLHVSNSSLDKMSSAAKLFHATLKDIRKQIEPVIHTNLYNDFADNKPINHETRWSDPDDVVKAAKEEKEAVKNETLDTIKIKQEVSEPSEMEIDLLEDNKDNTIK